MVSLAEFNYDLENTTIQISPEGAAPPTIEMPLTPGHILVAADGNTIIGTPFNLEDVTGTAAPVGLNVKDAPFLAIGDGVTNDTASVQIAIDTILLSGGETDFSAGTYWFADTIPSARLIQAQGI